MNKFFSYLFFEKESKESFKHIFFLLLSLQASPNFEFICYDCVSCIIYISIYIISNIASAVIVIIIITNIITVVIIIIIVIIIIVIIIRELCA